MIVGTFRVQCGGCRAWLRRMIGGGYACSDEANATPYESDSYAAKDAAKAGWWDGRHGEYAKCTCMDPAKPGREMHKDACRVMKPHYLLRCHDCQEKGNTGVLS